MEKNVFSLPQLLWQVFNVLGVQLIIGLLLASAVLVFRMLHLVRKGRKDPVTEDAVEKATLGGEIRAYRTKCRMTQEFVAEALGVSRQAVSKWESGASDPSTSNLMALAKLFEVPAEALLRGGKS